VARVARVAHLARRDDSTQTRAPRPRKSASTKSRKPQRLADSIRSAGGSSSRVVVRPASGRGGFELIGANGAGRGGSGGRLADGSGGSWREGRWTASAVLGMVEKTSARARSSPGRRRHGLRLCWTSSGSPARRTCPRAGGPRQGEPSQQAGRCSEPRTSGCGLVRGARRADRRATARAWLACRPPTERPSPGSRAKIVRGRRVFLSGSVRASGCPARWGGGREDHSLARCRGRSRCWQSGSARPPKRTGRASPLASYRKAARSPFGRKRPELAELARSGSSD